MFVRIAQCFIACALCLSMGGQWLGAQSLAWARMVVSYSQHCSFHQALVQTLDGSHPCRLCKYVSKGRDTEKKQETRLSGAKFDLILAAERLVLLPRFIAIEFPDLTRLLNNPSQEAPPKPPPRLQLA